MKTLLFLLLILPLYSQLEPQEIEILKKDSTLLKNGSLFIYTHSLPQKLNILLPVPLLPTNHTHFNKSYEQHHFDTYIRITSNNEYELYYQGKLIRKGINQHKIIFDGGYQKPLIFYNHLYNKFFLINMQNGKIVGSQTSDAFFPDTLAVLTDQTTDTSQALFAYTYRNPNYLNTVLCFQYLNGARIGHPVDVTTKMERAIIDNNGDVRNLPSLLRLCALGSRYLLALCANKIIYTIIPPASVMEKPFFYKQTFPFALDDIAVDVCNAKYCYALADGNLIVFRIGSPAIADTVQQKQPTLRSLLPELSLQQTKYPRFKIISYNFYDKESPEKYSLSAVDGLITLVERLKTSYNVTTVRHFFGIIPDVLKAQEQIKDLKHEEREKFLETYLNLSNNIENPQDNIIN